MQSWRNKKIKPCNKALYLRELKTELIDKEKDRLYITDVGKPGSLYDENQQYMSFLRYVQRLKYLNMK